MRGYRQKPGGDKRDIDNDTWAFILDMCPALRRYFHQCGSENWNTGNRGNAAESAAGVSFVAYTGQVFSEKQDMGMLEFPSVESEALWARAWVGFRHVGLGPPVDEGVTQRGMKPARPLLEYTSRGEPTN